MHTDDPTPDLPLDAPDLDKPLAGGGIPTWDYPHSTSGDDDDDDPSAPRVIVEVWSGQPSRPDGVPRPSLDDLDAVALPLRPLPGEPSEGWFAAGMLVALVVALGLVVAKSDWFSIPFVAGR